jgi:hypothetical protein
LQELAQETAYLYARTSDDIVVFTHGALSNGVLLPSPQLFRDPSGSGSRIVTKSVSSGRNHDLRWRFHLAVHNVL